MTHSFRPGSSPLLVSFPHNGSTIPIEVGQHMTDAGRSSRDTDWFLNRLYDIPELENASLLIAKNSRYVIDLNRPSNDQSLYPGQNTTGLIPEICFDGSPIYESIQPDKAEIERRIKSIWEPYHQQIERELSRLRDQFGFAVLIEAHSIASEVPMLFEGKIPDFNLGTNQDQSASPELLNRLKAVLSSENEYTYVANGRFVGGYITRQFGQPEHHWHALQIELSQATYLDEPSATWDDHKAMRVQKVFRKLFQAISSWEPNR